ncbi:hypothetical protein HUT17_04660 (plasmid) [Nocardiopsis flavescens]|uniref:SWIM zinc finger protein n=1 Tax=Nocardiopsis flavescens TaxID=758803 RepID=A0A6M5K8F1_9ACTN|nr:SWIM zinc finger protein [Nocardiopsis flavescens]QKW32429.1 hypothetical protein HUT17_04660 [Nocardiopsis flavescens]
MSREFGTTAWGRDWRRLAEPTLITRPDPALPRARSMARRDRVRDIVVAPGRITAVVDERSPHDVVVDVPVWDAPRLERARETLSHTYGDDLPDTVHAELSRIGQPPGPDPVTLTATCGCTGRKIPCPHILATYFEMARRLDQRPRLALVLRGLTDAHAPLDTARIPIGLIDPVDFYGS